jgi:GLPGLI family protein
MKHIFIIIILNSIIFSLSAQTFHATFYDPKDSSEIKKYHLVGTSQESLFYLDSYDSETSESENKDAYGLPEDFQINFGSKKKYIYKDYNNNSLIELLTDFYGDYHQITDSLHSMEWEITDQVLNIKGYDCTKAITRFRGRNYEAWFSPEIPFTTGPWKSGGLPGLILKLKEKSGMLDMELRSITFSEEDPIIELPKLKKVNSITGPELHKLYFDQMEEYFAFKEAQLRKKGSNISITVNRPQIELLEIYQ